MKTGAAFEFAPFLKAFANVGLLGMAMDIERGVAQDIVDRAQTIVHVGGADDPNAGETRESLMVQDEGFDARGGWIDVGSKLEKAFFEEFGSIHGAGVHFLEIAIAEAMSGHGGFGVSWAKMHRPAHSRQRPHGNK